MATDRLCNRSENTLMSYCMATDRLCNRSENTLMSYCMDVFSDLLHSLSVAMQ
jgi:hypothetical protein